MSKALRIHRLLLSAAFAVSLLEGCDREASAPASRDTAGDVSALPRPEAGAGSVTGFDGSATMPEPSAAVAGDDLASGPENPSPNPEGNEAADGIGSDMAPLEGGDVGIQAPGLSPRAPPTTPTAPPAGAEPGAADAAAVVRSYYAAINAGQYPRAYALWSDGGRASGQTGAQFAGGFSDTARVTASTGAPGRVEGAAGSRYVTVPVAVEAIQDDGTIRHYDGTYTLRRAVVDGATAEQRQWRISDADLRQVE